MPFLIALLPWAGLATAGVISTKARVKRRQASERKTQRLIRALLVELSNKELLVRRHRREDDIFEGTHCPVGRAKIMPLRHPG